MEPAAHRVIFDRRAFAVEPGGEDHAAASGRFAFHYSIQQVIKALRTRRCELIIGEEQIVAQEGDARAGALLFRW
jgi:hypothetical protein